jgi:hypothetical protein
VKNRSNSKNHMKPTLYNWGVNDLKYVDDFYINNYEDYRGVYSKWTGMMKRAMSPKYLAKTPSYDGSSICDYWQYLSEFKDWTVGQVWKGLELDKDILVVGNKHYSAETCAYVPKYVNYCFLTKQGGRGDCPIGVSKKIEKRYGPNYVMPNPYAAAVNDGTGTYIRLGTYNNPMDAHRAWQVAKADVIENTVLRYMLEPCYRQDVANAIYLRAEMLRDDHANYRETFYL